MANTKLYKWQKDSKKSREAIVKRDKTIVGGAYTEAWYKPRNGVTTGRKTRIYTGGGF